MTPRSQSLKRYHTLSLPFESQRSAAPMSSRESYPYVFLSPKEWLTRSAKVSTARQSPSQQPSFSSVSPQKFKGSPKITFSEPSKTSSLSPSQLISLGKHIKRVLLMSWERQLVSLEKLFMKTKYLNPSMVNFLRQVIDQGSRLVNCIRENLKKMDLYDSTQSNIKWSPGNQLSTSSSEARFAIKELLSLVIGLVKRCLYMYSFSDKSDDSNHPIPPLLRKMSLPSPSTASSSRVKKYSVQSSSIRSIPFIQLPSPIVEFNSPTLSIHSFGHTPKVDEIEKESVLPSNNISISKSRISPKSNRALPLSEFGNIDNHEELISEVECEMNSHIIVSQRMEHQRLARSLELLIRSRVYDEDCFTLLRQAFIQLYGQNGENIFQGLLHQLQQTSSVETSTPSIASLLRWG